LILPTHISTSFSPNPAYTGTRGPLPFSDPWLKVLIAFILTLIALLQDYFSDGSVDGGIITVHGKINDVDGDVDCCPGITISTDSSDNWTKFLYGVATAAWIACAAGDGPDVFYRGQENTPPSTSTEKTIFENMELKISSKVAPSPGTLFPVNASWKYTRTTNTGTYDYTTDEKDLPSMHYVSSYKVISPDIWDRKNGPFVVKALFTKKDGSTPYIGSELYVIGVLRSTHGINRVFELRDDGGKLDQKAGDGWYTGSYKFNRELDKPGYWYLFVYAQDVNTVPEGTDPFTAAHTIGGFVITPQLQMQFGDPKSDTTKPCELNHDKVIHVV
jgi:hypothetical protein